jgi:hypothetical protein
MIAQAREHGPKHVGGSVAYGQLKQGGVQWRPCGATWTEGLARAPCARQYVAQAAAAPAGPAWDRTVRAPRPPVRWPNGSCPRAPTNFVHQSFASRQPCGVGNAAPQKNTTRLSSCAAIVHSGWQGRWRRIAWSISCRKHPF